MEEIEDIDEASVTLASILICLHMYLALIQFSVSQEPCVGAGLPGDVDYAWSVACPDALP